MAPELIGRKKEKKILIRALESQEAEMISIIGRRRVGKTFLVRSVYKDRIAFEISGIQHAQGNEQLRNFTERLKEFFPQAILPKPPSDWLDAFFLLIELLGKEEESKKKVIFLDEVPWLATHKSGFLRALSHFWNSWAVRQNIVVVLCGSAASWMIRKILQDRGGLHNRVTKRIRLQSFDLSETEAYLRSRNIFFDRYQLLQIYMAMGGIPHYLKELEGGKSATQNIDRICFGEEGLLRDEFLSLYPALFEHSDYHVSIIQALANKHMGMPRTEIIRATKLPDGGRLSRVLEELRESGFISAYPPYGKRKKDQIFRLTDEYSLFYLRFIKRHIHDSEGAWAALSQTQSYKIWSGYSFENVCLKHSKQIRQALGISGVYAVTSSFLQKGTPEDSGAQIDLLIDRNDHVINLIETKFHNSEFTIQKSYAAQLRNKLRVFQDVSQTKKQVSLTFLTTFGVKPNQRSLGLVEAALTMDALFAE